MFVPLNSVPLTYSSLPLAAILENSAKPVPVPASSSTSNVTIPLSVGPKSVTSLVLKIVRTNASFAPVPKSVAPTMCAICSVMLKPPIAFASSSSPKPLTS